MHSFVLKFEQRVVCFKQCCTTLELDNPQLNLSSLTTVQLSKEIMKQLKLHRQPVKTEEQSTNNLYNHRNP